MNQEKLLNGSDETVGGDSHIPADSVFTLSVRPDNIGVITIDVVGDKVNTLKAEFAEQIAEVLQQAQALSQLQGLVIIVPALVGYLLFHEQLSLPSFDLTSLPVDWGRIGIGALIFATSFILFTGLLVLIGSSVPTAKEAGGFIGIIMMLIFGPLYAAPLFISQPDSPFVHFLSLFPFTAPIPLLLRNAVGNLQSWEIMLAIPIILVSAVIVLNLAVRVFRFGALEYSRKLSLKEIFGK